MAEVYLAHDDVLDRDVALKILSGSHSGDEEFIERFRREAQSAAALTHPNIVSIYDRGETDDEPGTYYIAMEYLPGGSLKDRITSRGALPARTAAEVALQIAEALKAAHDRNVVHRDIKPHNILVTESGDLKVTDFGIARAATSSTMTRTGSIMGTAHYISPEQAMGDPAGPQSDLYSLGVVLYEMLTGELPFDAETPIGIAMKHVNAGPAPPGERDPSIPEGLNAITLRLMSKNPEERYPDESELIRDLENVVRGYSPGEATTRGLAGAAPVAPAGGGDAERTLVSHGGAASGGRRRRRALPLVVLGILALLALVGWGAYTMIPQPPPTAQVPEIAGLSLEDARERLGGDFDISVSERRDSQEPEETILEQDPSPGSEREQGSEISVVVSGQQVVEVPDVIGEPRDEAESRLSEEGFDVSVETEESSAGEEGNVTSQSPSAGGEADFESEVTITVGEGPYTVQAPDLSGLTVSEAESELADADLELGEQTEAASGEVSEGDILDQTPASGSEAEPGSAVDVTVSTGPEQSSVPDLYGYGETDAEAILADAGLELGQVTEEETDELAEGLIFSQSLSGGATAEPGTEVDVTVSAGPSPVSVPNVIGDEVIDAQQELLELGLGYTTQGIQSDEPAGTVLSTDPASGAEVEPETQVAISYSLGQSDSASAPTPTSAPEPAPDPSLIPAPDNGSGGDDGGSSGSLDPGGGNGGGGFDGGSSGGFSGSSDFDSGSGSSDRGGSSDSGSGESADVGSGAEEDRASGNERSSRETRGSGSRNSGGASGSGGSGVQSPDIEEPEAPEPPDVEVPDL